MKKIGIMGAMDLEVKTLIDAMAIKEEVTIAGSQYFIGELNGKEIVVTCCGVGKVNAASGTQALISNFNVEAIINTGIAGGMAKNVKVGDLVVSTDTTHHDVNPVQMLSCSPKQAYFTADSRLIDAAKASCEKIEALKNKFHLGRIVSGESFISSSKVKKEIIEAFNPHCVEMEGSAIGHVSFLNNVPFVLIRSISDSADEGADESYDNFETITAEQSSNLVKEMLLIL